MLVLENILPTKIADEMESVVTDGLFPWYLSRDISKNKIAFFSFFLNFE